MAEWLRIEPDIWIAGDQITMVRAEAGNEVAIYVVGRDEPVLRTPADNWRAFIDKRAEKRKVAVSISTKSGEMFEGNVFCTGEQRVKDLLNGTEEFVAFETMGGQLYLVARSELARVVPRPEHSENSRSDFA